ASPVKALAGTAGWPFFAARWSRRGSLAPGGDCPDQPRPRSRGGRRPVSAGPFLPTECHPDVGSALARKARGYPVVGRVLLETMGGLLQSTLRWDLFRDDE